MKANFYTILLLLTIQPQNVKRLMEMLCVLAELIRKGPQVDAHSPSENLAIMLPPLFI